MNFFHLTTETQRHRRAFSRLGLVVVGLCFSSVAVGQDEVGNELEKVVGDEEIEVFDFEEWGLVGEKVVRGSAGSAYYEVDDANSDNLELIINGVEYGTQDEPVESLSSDDGKTPDIYDLDLFHVDQSIIKFTDSAFPKGITDNQTNHHQTRKLSIPYPSASEPTEEYFILIESIKKRIRESYTKELAQNFDPVEIEVLHTFGKGEAPGNIAVSPENRIFISLHQFYGPELKVAEVLEDGSLKTYPNADWNRTFEEVGHETLNRVLGLRCDRDGILWLLDRAPEGGAGKLVAWDTRKEELHRVIMLDKTVIGEQPFLNDLAVDRENEAVYIADTASGHDSALIVVDLETGNARRVLEGSTFTKPEDVSMIIDGRAMTLGGEEARIGVNPITVDPTNTWVYFGPMSGFTLYRVQTKDLLDVTLSYDELESRVERYGDKPICDGITMDARGNIYITSVTDNSIYVMLDPTNTENAYSFQLFQDDRLSWPDGMAVTPDGDILVTVNQLHRSPVLSGTGEDISTGPPNNKYYILRFRSPYPAVHGR